MSTAWTPIKVLSDPQLPFVTLVCVDDVDEPTQEMTMRIDAHVVTTRVL